MLSLIFFLVILATGLLILWISQRTRFWFHYFSLLISSFQFLDFCFNFYHFLYSASLDLICFSFSNFLKWNPTWSILDLIDHLYCILWKNVYSALLPTFQSRCFCLFSFFVFSFFSYGSFLYIFLILTPFWLYDLQISSSIHLVAFFVFLMFSFAAQKVFNLI